MGIKRKWLVCWLTVMSCLPFNSHAESSGNKDQQLVEAARQHDIQTIRSLLGGKEVNVNAAQGDGATALAWSVYWDDLETVRLFIRSGADVNAANELGVTPLMLAGRNRNVEMMKILLESGADPDMSTWSGVTALMVAARNGTTRIVELLLAHGADSNHQEPRRHHSALMWAISFMHPEIAKILIEHGADVSASTIKLKEDAYSPMVMKGYGENVETLPQGGYTPLMFAARVGDMATARLLVDKGADVNAVSAADGSALVIAAAEGHEDIALYLLEQGADPDIAGANGMTPLHYTMRDGLKSLHHYETKSVKRICGLSLQGKRGCKPYEVTSEAERAAANDPSAGIKLIEAGAKSSLVDGDPSSVMPGNNMYELAEALLAAGAKVDVAMKYPPAFYRLDAASWLSVKGATPFFLASAASDSQAMEILLEHGANPSLGTEIDQHILVEQTELEEDDNHIMATGTPFMVAIGMGKQKMTLDEEKTALDLAKRLVSLGVDIKAATASGWTALHSAAFMGANLLVEFLVQNGADVNAKNGCGRTPLSLAEGESTKGLLTRPELHAETVDLLIRLGADRNTRSVPVGQCVLGRGALAR